VALNDSAELQIVLIDCRNPAGGGERPGGVLRAVVGVQDRLGQAAPGPLRGDQGVDDEVGVHVVGDRAAGQPARVQIDGGGPVAKTALTDRARIG
jgi:hypothetical protein